jgi:prolyl oligopeptidase
VPQSKPSIVSSFSKHPTLIATQNRVYVLDQIGGPNQVRIFDHTGHSLGRLPLPKIASVTQMVPAGGDDILFDVETYLAPSGWYRYSAARGDAAPTALQATSPADFSDCELVREYTPSKDGTAVPLNIIRRRGTKLDGSNPTLLTGYGGYGISLSPHFSPVRRLFLEQGGVVAIANLRGGGEFGEEWHRLGNLTRKQNVFDDFDTAAKRLIELGYTRREKLAIIGGSNGGLLMGATITQHPDFCRAVVSLVGIYDMLRVELSPKRGL